MRVECVFFNIFSDDDMQVKNSGLKCCMERSSDEPEPAEHSFDTGRTYFFHSVSLYKHQLQVSILSIQKKNNVCPYNFLPIIAGLIRMIQMSCY
jgi:hypothetical protein